MKCMLTTTFSFPRTFESADFPLAKRKHLTENVTGANISTRGLDVVLMLKQRMHQHSLNPLFNYFL